MDTLVTEQKIQQVADKIVQKFQPEKIILFGSWAWGTPKANSDVDLLVIKDTENTRTLAREIDGHIFPRPFPLDLIVYRPDQIQKNQKLGDSFVTHILNKGKILYAK